MKRLVESLKNPVKSLGMNATGDQVESLQFIVNGLEGEKFSYEGAFRCRQQHRAECEQGRSTGAAFRPTVQKLFGASKQVIIFFLPLSAHCFR